MDSTVSLEISTVLNYTYKLNFEYQSTQFPVEAQYATEVVLVRYQNYSIPIDILLVQYQNSSIPIDILLVQYQNSSISIDTFQSWWE